MPTGKAGPSEMAGFDTSSRHSRTYTSHNACGERWTPLAKILTCRKATVQQKVKVKRVTSLKTTRVSKEAELNASENALTGHGIAIVSTSSVPWLTARTILLTFCQLSHTFCNASVCRPRTGELKSNSLDLVGPQPLCRGLPFSLWLVL